MADGLVVTWGEKHFLELVLDPLNRVQQIQATCCSFAAILEDGSVVTWGCRGWGGDSSEVRDQLQGVRQIQATHYGAFAAILEDGSVVTWGCEDRGGDSSAVRDQLKGVSQIQATDGAFAAILEHGSVVSWGRKSVAVTARLFEISSGVCSTFNPHMTPLLQFWKMDLSFPGVMKSLASIIPPTTVIACHCGLR